MGYILDLFILVGVGRIFGGGGLWEFRTKGLLVLRQLLLLAHFFWGLCLYLGLGFYWVEGVYKNGQILWSFMFLNRFFTLKSQFLSVLYF